MHALRAIPKFATDFEISQAAGRPANELKNNQCAFQGICRYRHRVPRSPALYTRSKDLNQ